MKKILILGAGKSATDLIQYLLDRAEANDWKIIVGDLDEALAKRKINGHERGEALFFDVFDEALRKKLVEESDIVASLLPAKFHYLVGQDCLTYSKHFITPSYVSANDQALDEGFKAKGLLYMAEMGLDPGIDHMSLMKAYHEILEKGGKVKALRSYTGALIAPESDDHPWHYKFTWAPMNVVLAGQGGTAQYLRDGKPCFIPYNRLFTDTEVYEVEGVGRYEAYANRDSISYIDTYDLKEVPTFIRGTLRKEGYCAAWNALVRLGWTDNQLQIKGGEDFTYTDLLTAFLPDSNKSSLKERLADFLEIDLTDSIMDRLTWLGIFDHIPVKNPNASPAQMLHDLLVEKWVFKTEDKDLIVMLHLLDYELDGKTYRKQSVMSMIGKDHDHTAIAATVGFPMAIMVKLLLENKVKLSGVQIPTMPEVYIPCLQELETLGIHFKERDIELANL